jgi:DNA-binding SARP family transcriptional activator
VRLGVLGALLVADEAGRQVRLAGRGRVLLAALALRANHVVSGEELTELVFDGVPSAESTLRSYIWRLRAVLGPAGAQRIVTSPPGYLCRADEQEVDALWFESLCGQTDTAIRERRWAEASRSAELAVSLWRGDPLFDVPSRILRDAFTPRLEQLHAQVLGNQAEAALALGRHEQWVQPLRDLVAEHPLRERFHAQLMQALSRSGRQAEALAAYHDARKILVDELGI